MSDIHLRFGPDEAQTLGRILQHYLGELRMEIAGTDRKDFRDGLEAEEKFVKGLLATLGGHAVTPWQVVAQDNTVGVLPATEESHGSP